MRGTFQIAKLFGIPVLLHWSFALIIFWVLYSGYSSGLDSAGTAWLGLMMLSLFVCVVLHEYGHALTARVYGVNTKDIVLLPIGGVARLDSLPDKPIQEFLIAAAGPLVNIAIALVLSITFLWTPFAEVERQLVNAGSINATTFVPYLIFLNITLAIFNLLPAFPMDGGRILRSLLAIKLGKVKATKVAAIIGQIFAGLFIVGSIYPFQNPVFTLLGVFIFLSAMQEYRAVKSEGMLKSVIVSEAMRTDFTKFDLDDTIRTALIVRGIKKEDNFIVVNENDEVVGVLHQAFIEEAEKQEDTQSEVIHHMNQLFQPVEHNAPLLETAQMMQKNGFTIVPIVQEGKVIGVLDEKSINEYLSMSLKKQGKRT